MPPSAHERRARRRRTSRSPGRSGSRAAAPRRSACRCCSFDASISAEPQVARRELDAVEVRATGPRAASAPRSPAPCAYCSIFVVVGVAEADRRRSARRSTASVPVRKCQPSAESRPAVALHVGGLLLRRQAGAFLRVEADDDHVELACRRRIRERLERADQRRSAPGCRASGTRSRPAPARPAACRRYCPERHRPGRSRP